jgi:hypothetical protein
MHSACMRSPTKNLSPNDACERRNNFEMNACDGLRCRTVRPRTHFSPMCATRTPALLLRPCLASALKKYTYIVHCYSNYNNYNIWDIVMLHPMKANMEQEYLFDFDCLHGRIGFGVYAFSSSLPSFPISLYGSTKYAWRRNVNVAKKLFRVATREVNLCCYDSRGRGNCAFPAENCNLSRLLHH